MDAGVICPYLPTYLSNLDTVELATCVVGSSSLQACLVGSVLDSCPWPPSVHTLPFRTTYVCILARETKHLEAKHACTMEISQVWTRKPPFPWRSRSESPAILLSPCDRCEEKWRFEACARSSFFPTCNKCQQPD